MVDSCVMCGEIIPEGRQVCPICEKGEPIDTKEKLEVIAHLGDHITYKEDIGICYDSELAKVIEDAYMTLKNVVIVQKWISVKDRLPEVETEVMILARHGNRNVITTGMYEDGQMNTEDSDWWWETEGFEYDEELDVHIIPEGWWEYKHYIDDETHNYAIDGVVTHWMPLPQPPKGE